jgi:hypothetical protein
MVIKHYLSLDHFEQETYRQIFTYTDITISFIYCLTESLFLFFSSVWQMQNIWSVVHLLRQNHIDDPPVVLPMYGLDLERRMLDKMLYEVDNSFEFPFHRKIYISLLVWCHPCPIWPPVLPPNLTYILIFFRNWHARTCPIQTTYVPRTKSHVHFL